MLNRPGILRKAALLLAAIAAVSTASIPVAAATVGTDEPQIIVEEGSASPDAQQPPCPISRAGRKGLYICTTSVLNYKWSDGRWHTFVIGADNAVWSIFIFADGRTTGWYSLGGQAKAGVFRNYATDEIHLGIAVTGLDNLRWCRNLKVDWDAWHHCQTCVVAC